MFQFGKTIKKVDLSKPNEGLTFINLKSKSHPYIGDPEEDDEDEFEFDEEDEDSAEEEDE